MNNVMFQSCPAGLAERDYCVFGDLVDRINQLKFCESLLSVCSDHYVACEALTGKSYTRRNND
ncbi:MAG: hypothetical protein D6B25_02855 [Desulfobulbaceae bacterium]|nr:MAG: hypothetical protein D6B25_02855 [Desulfobulbaceae bacterium]